MSNNNNYRPVPTSKYPPNRTPTGPRLPPDNRKKRGRGAGNFTPRASGFELPILSSGSGAVINTIAQFIANAFKVVIIVGGVIFVNVIDLAMGAIVVGLVFKNNVPIIFGLWLTPQEMGFAYSVVTGFIQTVAWALVISTWQRSGKDMKRSPSEVIFVIVMLLISLVMMGLDTFIDVSALEFITKLPAGDPLNFSLVGATPVYKALAVIIASICGLGELFTTFALFLSSLFVEDGKQ